MQIRWAYLKRVLAGAIFGLYMAHLLYFINPQVEVTPGRLALVTIVYGLICGLLFGSALWGLRVLRVKLLGKPDLEMSPDAYRAHGFGFVALAAFAASAIYWIHLTVLRIYLPIGAVRVLSKATIVITTTSFLLLLLWIFERNATRRTSRAIFVAGFVLIAISSLFLYQRRGSYRADKRNVVVANIGTVAGQRPVIVVAIRNLPYDWLLTLSGEGGIPFFDRARQQAYFTRLEPFPTTSDKALWATLATGKLPPQHGVTGRFAYRTPLNSADPSERFLLLPSGVGFRAWGLIPPVQRISSRGASGDSLPLWSIFERLHFHAAVVGWLWSLPQGATRIVTNDFFDTMHDRTKEVAPPQFAPAAIQLSQTPAPAIRERFNGTRGARDRILQALGNDLTSTAIARLSAADRGFGLTVLALDGFSDAQRALHIYSNELPPRSSIKGEALRAYVEQLDRMLDGLARDYPDHLLVVVSPSGPAPPPLPATAWALAREAILPVDPGADDGFVLITGAGVAHKENPSAARATDLVPTVLFGAGLPVGRDMDGRVLPDAFTEEFLRRNALTAIQTY
ncbi:MAG: hypothetical protein JWO56_3460, partial [Acidobacteria bacterium]|nr:hypothetical protein [Acidobacteriota bacterium]